MEIWKDIEGYEGYYQVSTYGNVRSLDREIPNRGRLINIKGKILSPSIHYKNGYCSIQVSKDNKVIRVLVHILVAKTFIPNPNKYPQVNHIDGDKTNNNDWNLEWCTGSQNILHAYSHNLMNIPIGSDRKKSKISENDVINIRKLYENGEKRQIDLANMYNLTDSTIWHITNRKTWKHVI